MASSCLYFKHDQRIYTVNHVIHVLNEAAIAITGQPYFKWRSLSLPKTSLPTFWNKFPFLIHVIPIRMLIGKL
jgi:hypothetical protein